MDLGRGEIEGACGGSFVAAVLPCVTGVVCQGGWVVLGHFIWGFCVLLVCISIVNQLGISIVIPSLTLRIDYFVTSFVISCS